MALERGREKQRLRLKMLVHLALIKIGGSFDKTRDHRPAGGGGPKVSDGTDLAELQVPYALC